MLQDPFQLVVIASIALVLLILVVGVVGFALGGAFNRKYANLIMRYRIAAQAVAIVLILAFIWIRKGG